MGTYKLYKLRILLALKMGYTKLDYLERLGQISYFAQCVFMTDWWTLDNFADQTTPAAREHNLITLMGFLVLGFIFVAHTVRSSPCCEPMLKQFDFATAGAWGG